MEINKVAMIGRGAIGAMFANQIQNKIGQDHFCFIADHDRCERYKKEGFYLNGLQCDFRYCSDVEQFGMPDLIIISVKYPMLKQSIEKIRSFVNENTIILSLLNGIVSEKIVEETLQKGIVLHSIAQLMDAVSQSNCVTYHNLGEIIIGSDIKDKEKYLNDVSLFFDKVNIPHQIVSDIIYKQWSKLMLNCGINQVCAVYDIPYKGCQKSGKFRNQFIETMKEVMLIAKMEGIELSENDITQWLTAVEHLDSEAMPSMRQDMLALRYSEVDLFAKTMIDLADKHHINVPMNEYLYQQIKMKESKF